MVPAGQHAHIGLPQVGEIPAMAAIARGAPAISAGPWPYHAGPAPRPRCAGWHARRPARARLFAAVGPQTSTFHPVPALLTPFPAPFWGVSGEVAAKPPALFFIRLAIVTRETPVTRAILRCELRSLSSSSTCAYCTALATAAGVKRAWCPQPLHWYLAWPPALPLRRICSLPQAAQKCCVKTIPKTKQFTLN